MKNINLLGCHLLSQTLGARQHQESSSAVVLGYIHTNTPWLAPGQWQCTLKWNIGRDKHQWFPAPPEIQTPKNILIFEIMDWHTFVNCYKEIWSTHGRCSLAGVTQQVAKFWKICIKNLGDTRNAFTFGYVEVQRLCAVADTAAFALALF